MKARIEHERRSAGRDLELDLKEGPGGIRDVEFLVQAFQLFYGGREPRCARATCSTALRSARRGSSCCPQTRPRSLRDAYLWLRRAEHALQLAEEQQTARVPANAPRQHRAGAAHGLPRSRAPRTARDRLLEDWTAARGEVRSHFEALVLGAASDGASRAAPARRRSRASPLAARLAAAAAPLRRAPLRRRRCGATARRPALRGLARARRDPARARRLPVASPGLARARRARWTPGTLGRRARASSPRARWTSSRRRSRDRARRAAPAAPRGDGARRLLRSRRPRPLRGASPSSSRSSPRRSSATRSALARASCAAPYAAGFAVIGMGKIAGREFTYHSDLDLIFLYAGRPDEIDAGLAHRPAPDLVPHDHDGRGHRLRRRHASASRPARQGMLVTSFDGFDALPARDRGDLGAPGAAARARDRRRAGDRRATLLAACAAYVLARRPQALAVARRPARARRARARAASAARTRPQDGAGGLMDVDFLAGGGLLERGAPRTSRRFRASPRMLAARCAARRATSSACSPTTHALRVVEARARWVAGRAVEEIPAEGEGSRRSPSSSSRGSPPRSCSSGCAPRDGASAPPIRRWSPPRRSPRSRPDRRLAAGSGTLAGDPEDRMTARLDYPAFDCDNHYYEALDAFTRHMDPRLAKKAVQWAVIDGRKRLLVAERINRFIPNPTFDPVAKPGCLDHFFRGDNPEGLDIRAAFGELEPIRPAYRDRDGAARADGRAGDRGLPAVPDARRRHRAPAAPRRRADARDAARLQPMARRGLGLRLARAHLRGADALADGRERRRWRSSSGCSRATRASCSCARRPCPAPSGARSATPTSIRSGRA